MKSIKVFLLVLLSLFLSVFSSAVCAENIFIFSTEPQNISVGTMSGKINVQSQTPVTETTYLSFTSSSPTGQFLNSSGNPLMSVYISKGDSNRAIYYKDSTSGDFVITAEIQNKEKVAITSISQHIIVGTGSSGGESNATTTTDATTDNQTVEPNPASFITSAHSSPAPLSSTEKKTEFEISAGRDRLTAVGNSMVFRAELTKSQNVPEIGITYFWSFGDGTTARGNVINHTYKFAGDYSVVANASYSDRQAVSRMQVRVISPNIAISRVSGGVEISNNSGAEINLESWSMVSLKKTFTFPTDTLIPHGKKIIFADEVTGIYSDTIQLINPLGKEFAGIKGADELVVANEIPVDLGAIQARVEEVKTAIARISPKVGTDKVVVKLAEETGVAPTIVKTEPTKIISPKNNTAQASNTAIVFEAQKQSGLISRIFAWPIRGVDFVRRLFVEE